MSRPTFLRQVVVALALSFVGSVLFVSVKQITSPHAALQGIISLVALCYSGYLLAGCSVTTGRVTVAATWFTVAAACWFGNLSTGAFVLIHISMIWVIRSLFYHSSPITALLDFILTGLSFAAAVWAMLQSESLFLSLWSFFLVQALFVFIPASLEPLAANNHLHDQQFQSAYRTAEAALGKLSSPVRS